MPYTICICIYISVLCVDIAVEIIFKKCVWPTLYVTNRVLQMLCVLAVEVLLRVISFAVRDSEMIISMVMLAVPVGFYILLAASGVKIEQAIESVCMYVYVCMYVLSVCMKAWIF